VKAQSASGKTYPVEKRYFLLPPEAAKIYGAQAEEIDVMFPVENEEVIFPQRYLWFGSSKGPKCMGDGETAIRANDKGEFESRSCPCELLKKKDCNPRAHLLVILPKVTMSGVYQIDISSYHSIVDLNSGIDWIRALVGRIAMIPLKLRRVPKETHGSGRKEVHYPLQIKFPDMDYEGLQKLQGHMPRLTAGASPEQAPLAEECKPEEPEVLNPTQDDAEVEKPKPGEVICPEFGPISTKSCESCKSRQGCPAWD
jgi:hypothetical protein